MTQNSELRARARAQLKGSIFSSNWLMALVVCLIYSLLISASSFIGVGPIIVEGLLLVALNGVFLSLARKQKNSVEITDLFHLPQNIGDALVLAFLKYIFIFLWSLLFVIPGIIKTYSYSMAFYIKHDHPEYDWKRCLDESRRMMDGNKWRLFCLDFSFIGWIIVGYLCCGIGLLWVIPYMEAARANFYTDLADPKISVDAGENNVNI